MISSVLFLLMNQTMTPPTIVNYLINPGFKNELVGWEVKGEVSVSSEERLKGKSSVTIGKAGGSLSQTYKVPGERI